MRATAGMSDKAREAYNEEHGINDMTTAFDRKLESLCLAGRGDVAACAAYVKDTFEIAALACKDMEAMGVALSEKLLVAMYDRLNAEMTLRQVDPCDGPPRGGPADDTL